MPLGKTPILQSDTMAEADNNKYLLFNNAIVKLEDSVQRENQITVSSDTTITLTESQFLDYGVQKLLAANNTFVLNVPNTVGTDPISTTQRLFTVLNQSGFTVTVSHTTGSGTTVDVPSGSGVILYADGTDITSVAGAGAGAGGTLTVQDGDSDITSGTTALSFDETAFVVTALTGVRAQVALAAGFGAVPVQDDAVEIVAQPSAINFTGNGVAVTDVSGAATVNIPGTTIRANGGSDIPSATQPPTNIDFIAGTGVTLTLVDDLDGTVSLTVDAASSSVPVQDDGSQITAAPTALNFTGDGVTVTDVAGVATIDIPSTTLDPTLTLNNQTGTSYTLQVADAEALVTMSNASANTVTIPTSATLIPLGSRIYIRQGDTGTTTVTPDGGVTFNNAGLSNEIGENQAILIVKVDANEWQLIGRTGTGTQITIQDEGVDQTTFAESINFTGDGVAASAAGGVVTVNIPGGGGGGGDVAVQEEGSNIVAAADTINFVGNKVTVDNPSGNTARVTVADTPVQDEGSQVTASPTALNFTGGGVTVTDNAGVAEIAIAGGGSSSVGNGGVGAGARILETYDFAASAVNEIIVNNADLYDEIQFVLNDTAFGAALYLQLSEDGTTFDTATTNYTTRQHGNGNAAIINNLAGMEVWDLNTTANRFGSITVRNMSLPIPTESETKVAGAGGSEFSNYTGSYETGAIHKAIKILVNGGGNMTAGTISVVGVNYRDPVSNPMSFKGARRVQASNQALSAPGQTELSFSGGTGFNDGGFENNGTGGIEIPEGTNRVRVVAGFQLTSAATTFDFELRLKNGATVIAATTGDGTSSLFHGATVDSGVVAVTAGDIITAEISLTGSTSGTTEAATTFLAVEDVSTVGGFGGSWEVIGTLDTASFTGNQDYTNLGQYAEIMVIADGLIADGSNFPLLQVGSNGTFETANYRRFGVSDTSDPVDLLTGVLASFSSAQNNYGSARFTGFNKAIPTYVTSFIAQESPNGTIKNDYITPTATAHDSLRFTMAGTMNASSGNIYVLGVRDVSNAAKIRLDVVTVTADTTLDATHEGAYVRASDPTAINITVPAEATTNYAVGTTINLEQVDAGTVTIVPDTGVTINAAGSLSLRAQYSIGILTKIAADTWTLGGDITPT